MSRWRAFSDSELADVIAVLRAHGEEGFADALIEVISLREEVRRLGGMQKGEAQHA